MIRKFIEENKISFLKGNRNLSLTILIGYAQYLEMSKDDFCNELYAEIMADSFILEETNRLWDYFKGKNYKAFWVKPEAKEQYTF